VDSYWNYGISTNSGATWTTNTEPQIGSEYGAWICAACSADGKTLVGMNANGVWVSTNSGGSWFSNNVPGVKFWVSVALSADGTKAVAVDGRQALVAGSSGGGIYISTNSGMTWSETLAPTNTWTSVASSADGTVLAAAVLGAPTVPVYVSTNSGTTWAPTYTPTNINCYSMASSADGRKLIVGGLNLAHGDTGIIYTSTNLGNTWISNSVPFSYNPWFGVASSADGTRLAAVGQDGGGAVVTSTNSGTTWTANNVPIPLGWLSVASSADGTKLAALSEDEDLHGGIWTWQTTPSPVLGLAQANGDLALSWLIPSTNFVLQENTKLTTTNWSSLTDVPILNLTNLQNQITLPAPASNAFFRLKTP
jgi:hypothetical protein